MLRSHRSPGVAQAVERGEQAEPGPVLVHAEAGVGAEAAAQVHGDSTVTVNLQKAG